MATTKARSTWWRKLQQDWELDGLRHHLERAIKTDGPDACVKVQASATLDAVKELLERRAAERKGEVPA